MEQAERIGLTINDGLLLVVQSAYMTKGYVTNKTTGMFFQTDFFDSATK